MSIIYSISFCHSIKLDLDERNDFGKMELVNDLMHMKGNTHQNVKSCIFV